MNTEKRQFFERGEEEERKVVEMEARMEKRYNKTEPLTSDN